VSERGHLTETCELVVETGDLTRVAADAIVNAANEAMLGGGGVDGAIHRAAGPRLLEACRAVPEVAPGVRCPTGEARMTPGFDLPARWVIHTVGPVFESQAESAPLLAAAHRAALALANERGLAEVAFPAISCGAYGYPPALAAKVALRACAAAAGSVRTIRFVLRDPIALEAWRAAAGTFAR